MTRSGARRSTVACENLEGRNLMSTTSMIGHATPAEVRGFNPQPDPPGAARFPASFAIPTDQFSVADGEFHWGV